MCVFVCGSCLLFVPNYILKTDYSNFVLKYSSKYNLNANFVYSIIKAESGFNPDATSVKNARGLMQITDQTGEWIYGLLGYDNFNKNFLYDPEKNIEIGCYYISRLINQFNGNVDTALAAYNAGSGNVSKWLLDLKYSKDGENLYEIPFGETKRYVKKVNNYNSLYEFVY